MIPIKRQILVAGNDLPLCQSIYDGMQDDLTRVCYMTSTVEALASYMRQDYCLVILGIQLFDKNGIELLRTMRQTKHTPILALAESLNGKEKIALFHAGADACMEKPVDMEVCAAQAEALIRLYLAADMNRGLNSPVIHGEELIISPRYRQVMVDGKALVLTRKEFDLFHCLASYPGQIFSCEQLYNQVWGNETAIAVEESVKSQIKRLRKKLSSLGKDYIQNEWGVGYKFVLPEHT